MEKKRMEVTKIKAKIEGLSDIMFDRFIDYSKEIRPPEQKLYLIEDNQVVLPAENIYFFLFGENPAGCAKSFEGAQGKKKYIPMGMSHVFIDPFAIPFTEKNKPILFENFDGKFRIWLTAPRTKKSSLSIKQEAKPRPFLKLPWALEFNLTIIKNQVIDETKLYNWFVQGGIQIGIGTYRPRFGRFAVVEWKEI